MIDTMRGGTRDLLSLLAVIKERLDSFFFLSEFFFWLLSERTSGLFQEPSVRRRTALEWLYLQTKNQ
jgi:hypothetical protein